MVIPVIVGQFQVQAMIHAPAMHLVVVLLDPTNPQLSQLPAITHPLTNILNVSTGLAPQ
jgi:hypothetical protein